MAAISARPYMGIFVRFPRVLVSAARVAAWTALCVAVATLAFVAISQVLGWRLVGIEQDIPGAPAHGSLAVFEGVPSHGLYRGDVVLYREPSGTQTVRRVAALAADGSFVLEGTNGAESARGAPGDFRGLYIFAIPFIGPVASWAASPVGVGVLAGLVAALVIILAAGRILAPRRVGMSQPAYLGSVRRRIVTYSHLPNEDAIVKFPLRRQRPNNTAEASTSAAVQRLTQAVHAVEASSRPDPIDLRPADACAEDESLGAGLRLRNQYSAADARTDRLVRQMREEVADLREAFEQRAEVPVAEPDIAAILADPDSAADAPPAHLVRALQAANERHAELLTALAHEQKRSSKLRTRLRKRRAEQAATDARLETLQDVIAALHANLEDLRLERDTGYRLASPSRNGQEQLTTQTRFPVLPGND